MEPTDTETAPLEMTRRLRAKKDTKHAPVHDDDIPAEFDAREAFPECAEVIGRIRDQSDCGSCWAFASTEAFNDRRCIVGIDKGSSKLGREASAEQLLVLSAEDTTACCHGFRCGLRYARRSAWLVFREAMLLHPTACAFGISWQGMVVVATMVRSFQKEEKQPLFVDDACTLCPSCHR